MINFIGATAALSAALLWAASAIIFEDISKKVSPNRLNFYKGAIATLLLATTSLVLKETITQINSKEIWVLAISGVIGIAVGDSAYLQSVRKIGARRALTLFTLAPPMAALIALVFLGERLPFMTWTGIMITVAGVMWVVTENADKEKTKIDKKDLIAGISFGAIAAFCQAAGVVLTRSVLTETSLTTLQSTVVRFVPALLSLVIIIYFQKGRESDRQSTKVDRKLAGLILLAAFIGGYICLWLQQISIQNMPAGITQTMLSTSPIFILPMTALRGDKVSIRTIIGAVVAIFGVTLIFGLIG